MFFYVKAGGLYNAFAQHSGGMVLPLNSMLLVATVHGLDKGTW